MALTFINPRRTAFGAAIELGHHLRNAEELIQRGIDLGGATGEIADARRQLGIIAMALADMEAADT